MKSVLVAFAVVTLSAGIAVAGYQKDGRLKWTWDGSFLPPVIAGPGLDFPSMKQANEAFWRARDESAAQTIDFGALSDEAEEPAAIFLFACKSGGYDAYRHLVQQDSNFVHCLTYFTNQDRQKLFAATVNFQKRNRESWNMLVPMSARDVDNQSMVIRACRQLSQMTATMRWIAPRNVFANLS